jgi:hypothetical protein
VWQDGVFFKYKENRLKLKFYFILEKEIEEVDWNVLINMESAFIQLTYGLVIWIPSQMIKDFKDLDSALVMIKGLRYHYC